MTTRPSPSPLSAPRSPSSYHSASPGDRLAAVPSPMLKASARRVVAAWERQYGEVTDGIVEALEALVLTVHRQQADLAAPLDAPTRSVLGQRLLELLRTEVIQ